MIAAPDFFDEAINFVEQPQNDGQPYHVTPNDPGGATAWGATFQTWASWQRLHGRPVSMELFKAQTVKTLRPMFRSFYWNACSCNSFGAVGIQIFDAAFNCGPGNAAAFLQHVLGVEVDEEIGPITIRVAQQSDQRQLANELCAQREEFYATRSDATYFERGWDARAAACRDLVLDMLGVPRVAVPAPAPPPPPPPDPADNSADALNTAELNGLGAPS